MAPTAPLPYPDDITAGRATWQATDDQPCAIIATDLGLVGFEGRTVRAEVARRVGLALCAAADYAESRTS